MDTSSLTTAGLKVTASQTTPSRASKAPRPVWEVSGLTGGFEDLLYRLGGKKWRGAFSFWEDPTEALTEALQREGRTSFAERMEGQQERAGERAERCRERAEKAAERSDAAHEKFLAILAPMEPGQPILVGHHSEGRHRRALARADNAMRQSCEEQDKAEHYRGRALAAERTGAPKNLGFCQRRVEDAETELRRLRREISEAQERQADAQAKGDMEREGRAYAYIGRLSVMIREQEEQGDYWREQIEALGGVTFSKETVNKGDYVFRLKDSQPYLVVRANAKTVSVQSLEFTWFKPLVPYAEIRHVVTAAEYAAGQAKKEEGAE